MSSDPHPTTSLGGSMTSTNSPWIRRLHHQNHQPTSITRIIRDNSHSTYESRTPLVLPEEAYSHQQQQEHGEVVSGFGPYQFKATGREISEQFPLVARIARFGGDKRFVDNRRSKAFKLSPFFQFMPPPPPPPVKEEYHLAEVEFPGGVSEVSPNISLQMPESSNLANQEEGHFSFWNLARINRNKAVSSFASVPSPENLPRKRSKGWNHI